MIKATDLRIGNYVCDVVSNELMIVDELGENIGATLIDRDKYPLPNGWQMGYVPLTPELLEQIGFEKRLFFRQGSIYEMILPHTGLRFDLTDNGLLFASGYGSVYIKFLHELQNLYFALTNKELAVKIPQPA